MRQRDNWRNRLCHRRSGELTHMHDRLRRNWVGVGQRGLSVTVTLQVVASHCKPFINTLRVQSQNTEVLLWEWKVRCAMCNIVAALFATTTNQLLTCILCNNTYEEMNTGLLLPSAGNMTYLLAAVFKVWPQDGPCRCFSIFPKSAKSPFVSEAEVTRRSFSRVTFVEGHQCRGGQLSKQIEMSSTIHSTQ